MKGAGTECLAQAVRQMTPDEQAYTWRALKFYKDEFKQSKPSPGAAAGVHRLIDESVRELMGRPRADEVKCRKGCNHCCRQHVDITHAEAKLLHLAAGDIGYPIDRAKLQRQSQYDYKNWADQPAQDRSCVFLTPEGSCAVYEHRPMACRKYFVLSDPDLCDIVKHPGQEVLNFVSMEAEIVASAAIQAFGMNSLPTALLKSWPK